MKPKIIGSKSVCVLKPTTQPKKKQNNHKLFGCIVWQDSWVHARTLVARINVALQWLPINEKEKKFFTYVTDCVNTLTLHSVHSVLGEEEPARKAEHMETDAGGQSRPNCFIRSRMAGRLRASNYARRQSTASLSSVWQQSSCTLHSAHIVHRFNAKFPPDENCRLLLPFISHYKH